MTTTLSVSVPGAADDGSTYITIPYNSSVDLHYGSAGITGTRCNLSDEGNSTLNTDVSPNTSSVITTGSLTSSHTYYFYCFDSAGSTSIPKTVYVSVQGLAVNGACNTTTTSQTQSSQPASGVLCSAGSPSGVASRPVCSNGVYGYPNACTAGANSLWDCSTSTFNPDNDAGDCSYYDAGSAPSSCFDTVPQYCTTDSTQVGWGWSCSGSNGGTSPSCFAYSGSAIPTLPDLIAGAVTPITATVGVVTPLSVPITNSGTSNTSTTFHTIFQSAADVNGTSPGNPVAGSDIAGLNTSASKTATLSWTPSTAKTYYLRACADNNTSWGGLVTESDEGNNCGAWTAVTVSATIGVCSATHYSCSAGTSGSSVDGTSAYTWTCTGTDAIPRSCSEAKAALTVGKCAAPGVSPVHYSCFVGTSGSNGSNATDYTWTCTGTDNIAISCSEAIGDCGGNPPAGYPNACDSDKNACLQTQANGHITCDGTCSSTVPLVTTPTGATYGESCNPANICGKTNATAGSIKCDGTCSVSAPSDSLCPPTKPEISALWQGSTYLGTTAPAYDPSGYGVLARATSPSGANLNYYFEWSPTETSQWSGWIGSGGWGSVNHYADAAAGTYYVRAWSYDAHGNWSILPSDWLTITLTSAAPVVSCSGTPSNPYVNQPVLWTSTVSGGSRTYSYAWSGDQGLTGTGSSVSKAYTTVGKKDAFLTVTDTKSGLSTTATCSAGPEQSNGPGSGSGGGGCVTGACPGTCTAALSASPDTVEQGQNTTFTWSVSGGSLCASSCSGNGFNTGGAISGTANATVVPAPPTTAYALTCTAGTYGPPPPVNAVVTVLVPTAALSVNGQTGTARVNPNTANNVNVVWSSEHSASCSVTKNGAAWKTGLSSTGTSDTITSRTVYKVDCQNNHGTHATASVTVNVMSTFNEF